MRSFNSYTVYDREGNLLANARSPGEGVSTSPEPYFESLPADVKQRADVLLVLQEYGVIAIYRVHPAPQLGPRKSFSSQA